MIIFLDVPLAGITDLDHEGHNFVLALDAPDDMIRAPVRAFHDQPFLFGSAVDQVHRIGPCRYFVTHTGRSRIAVVGVTLKAVILSGNDHGLSSQMDSWCPSTSAS